MDLFVVDWMLDMAKLYRNFLKKNKCEGVCWLLKLKCRRWYRQIIFFLSDYTSKTNYLGILCSILLSVSNFTIKHVYGLSCFRLLDYQHWTNLCSIIFLNWQLIAPNNCRLIADFALISEFWWTRQFALICWLGQLIMVENAQFLQQTGWLFITVDCSGGVMAAEL